ncbi:hypothetical protein ACH4T9_12335 [Micromonospora sp. NPDC020750]|uniref:zinc finger domain-containing protein n=1 Tax=unclassified Micromonospora TaxID=2617518 RepID=UPI00379C0CF6
MTAVVFDLAAAQDAVAKSRADYQAMRAYWMADQSVKCPKCKAGFGEYCQSTGGGYGGPTSTHKARTSRITDWTDEQRQTFGEHVRQYRSRSWDGHTTPAEVIDRIAADAEAAAKPIPAAKAKPTNPRTVRLSENQAEEIERFACNAGKGAASTVHFHGDHQHRQTILALAAKGIIAEGGLISHGYEREYTLTGFGWRVYLSHRLIMRRAEGDRWAASLAPPRGPEGATGPDCGTCPNGPAVAA